MTLSDIKNLIIRRTKNTATNFPAADMLIAINTAYDRVNSIIRQSNQAYRPTAFTAADLTTGTAEPKFDSEFHELVALWPIHDYWEIEDPGIASRIFQKIQLKEAELKAFYGRRRYQEFTVTIADPGVFTKVRHGLNAGDRVILMTTGALPTGLSIDTYYWVISEGWGFDTFEVSSTDEGTAITTSGSQSGTHFFSVDKPAKMTMRPINFR